MLDVMDFIAAGAVFSVGAIVSIISAFVNGYFATRKDAREHERAYLQEIEELYTEVFDLCQRRLLGIDPFTDLIELPNRLPTAIAKIRLRAPKNVCDAAVKALNALNESGESSEEHQKDVVSQRLSELETAMRKDIRRIRKRSGIKAEL